MSWRAISSDYTQFFGHTLLVLRADSPIGQPVLESTLYCLARDSKLDQFKHVAVLSSTQDRYVPFHSARIQVTKVRWIEV
jgi:hypothetical protein